jgi:hypothetical protein
MKIDGYFVDGAAPYKYLKQVLVWKQTNWNDYYLCSNFQSVAIVINMKYEIMCNGMNCLVLVACYKCKSILYG